MNYIKNQEHKNNNKILCNYIIIIYNLFLFGKLLLNNI